MSAHRIAAARHYCALFTSSYRSRPVLAPIPTPAPCVMQPLRRVSGFETLVRAALQGRVIEDASYEDVLTIQVRRHRLESWADKPFFDRVLRGCMVRRAACAHTRSHRLCLQPDSPVIVNPRMV